MTVTRLFLSHAHRDAAVAAKIAAALDRAGLQTIQPARHLRPGASWRQSVKDGLADADAVVLVIATPDTVSNSWIAYEAGAAEALGKPIIVLASHDIPSDELPVELASHDIVLFDPHDPAAVAPTIRRRVRAIA